MILDRELTREIISPRAWSLFSLSVTLNISWAVVAAPISDIPTQLDYAHFVSTTSVSTPSRLRTLFLLHIPIVIRLVTTHPDCPHFVALVKVSDWNSFRINQIYSEICFRANPPNSSESIRKKFSISFDVIRLKINPSQSDSIRDFESEWIRTNLSILMNPRSEFFGLIRIEYSV